MASKVAPTPDKHKATGKLKRPKTYSTKDAIEKIRKANKVTKSTKPAKPTKPAKATKSTKSKTEVRDPTPEQAGDEGLVDEDDPEREWIGEIISETKTHYLMKWLDKDPVTDKYLYKPTREPKEYANKLAVEDWEHKKEVRAQKEAQRAREKAARDAAEQQRRAKMLKDHKDTETVIALSKRDQAQIRKKKRENRARVQREQSQEDDASAGAEDSVMQDVAAEPSTPFEQTEDSGHLAPDEEDEEDSDAEAKEGGEDESSDGIVVASSKA